MRTSILRLSNKPSYSIRSMDKSSSREDLLVLLKLYQALEMTQRGLSKKGKVDLMRYSQPQFLRVEDCLGNGEVLGAYVKEKVVGFITYNRIETRAEGVVGIIDYLYVEPGYRRIGIAEGLFRQAIDKMQIEGKVDYFTLGVLVQNTLAVKFYKALGLEPYRMTMVMAGESLNKP